MRTGAGEQRRNAIEPGGEEMLASEPRFMSGSGAWLQHSEAGDLDPIGYGQEQEGTRNHLHVWEVVNNMTDGLHTCVADLHRHPTLRQAVMTAPCCMW